MGRRTSANGLWASVSATSSEQEGVVDELTMDFGEEDEECRLPLALRWFIGQPFGLSDTTGECEALAAAELEPPVVGACSKVESSSQSEGNSPPSLHGSAALLAEPFLLFEICLGMAGAKRSKRE